MGQETTRLDDDRHTLPTTANDVTNSDDPDVIEHEIAQTRAEMSGTIDEIQERLNPDRLKEQAKEAAHDATIGRVVDAKDQAVEKVQEFAAQATDTFHRMTGGEDDRNRYGTGSTRPYSRTSRSSGNSIVDTIRANPVPTAIAGAGLGWFLMRRSVDNEDRSGYMRNTQPTRGGYRGQRMDYRTGYTSWDQRQPEPGHLREYEDDGFMGQVGSTGGDIVGMIQRNPVPAALAGIGLGWMLMRRSNNGGRGDQPNYYQPGRYSTYAGEERDAGLQPWGYGYQSNLQQRQSDYPGQRETDDEGGRMSEMTDAVQETAGDVMHRAQDMGSQAADQVSHFGSMARDQMGQLPHQAQGQFQNLRGTYQQRMNDNPLVMGVVAMGIGLAAGMLIPETQKENEVFGERRDELMERAQGMAGQAVVHAQEAAQDAVQSAQGLVAEKVTEAVKETVKDVTQHTDQSDTQSTATPS